MATRARTTSKRPAAKRAPARAKPSAEVVKVTPEQALTWLDGNVHNRRLRQRRVDDLAAAIERGEWVMNGDAVRFGPDGTLLDGQHRLWAVAQAEVPVEMLVIRGLDMGAQETMDQGARRNLGDVLELRGHRNGRTLASAVTYWWRYENGAVRVPSIRPTVAQALACLEENPTLSEAVTDSRLMVARLRYPTGVAACTVYEFTSIDAGQAEAFRESLVVGTDLKEGSPILALRRWLERRNSGEGNNRADAVVMHALTNKAWNAYRAGRKVDGHLAWKATGRNAEGFPEAE